MHKHQRAFFSRPLASIMVFEFCVEALHDLEALVNGRFVAAGTAGLLR